MLGVALMSATFITKAGLVDVVLRRDGLTDYQSVDEKAAEFEVYGVRIRVAALSDIIRSKEASNRAKDHDALPTLRALLMMKEEGDQPGL